MFSLSCGSCLTRFLSDCNLGFLGFFGCFCSPGVLAFFAFFVVSMFNSLGVALQDDGGFGNSSFLFLAFSFLGLIGLRMAKDVGFGWLFSAGRGNSFFSELLHETEEIEEFAGLETCLLKTLINQSASSNSIRSTCS